MKQHELLAIETDINGKTNVMLNESAKVFDQSSKFDEFTKTYRAFDDGDKDIPEAERKKMTTTVDERLKYLTKSLTASINILCSKEATNQEAKSDIIIRDEDGNVEATLAKDVPVCALLQLEKRFTEYRKLYVRIPTFNTDTLWVKGLNAEGEECYVEKESRLNIRTVTETVNEEFDPNPVKGSDKYKLETRQVKVNKPRGEYTTVTKTGRISPKEKANLLERVDKVLAAIKIARANANSIDVKEMNIGKSLLDFITD
jgi:hypothetical protein